MNKIPANPQHADDALIQEHEDYMRKVKESGLPTWMLSQYEFKSEAKLSSEDNDLEEILQGRNEDIIIEDEEDITGDV